MKDELPSGTIIGNDYRVINTLGRGGFGITYKCEDIRLKHIVAVKEYYPEGMVDRTPTTFKVSPASNSVDIFSWGKKKFLLEGTTLAAIQHKYSNEFIVKIIRFVEERGTAYLVMEFIDGMQIDDFANSNKIISATQVEKLFRNLCLKALKPIHDSSFYHRDIKPANILIRNSNGEPVIIDFGAARQTSGGKSTVALLTPRYSAVEQYASQEDMDEDENHDLCGPFTDIYSLAATFYYIIRGEPPLDAPSRLLNESTDKLVGDPTLSHYSANFLMQIDWGMKPIPKDRPQTIDEWLSAPDTSTTQTSSPVSKSVGASTQKEEIEADGTSESLSKKQLTDGSQTSNFKLGIVAVFVMLVLIVTLLPDSEIQEPKKLVAKQQAKAKIIPSTKKELQKSAWLIGVDAVDWTSIELHEKLKYMQTAPDGLFELKLHAEEPFRIKTQKGMATTKAEAKSFGQINGEVFLKSVNGTPQKVRVEITQKK